MAATTTTVYSLPIDIIRYISRYDLISVNRLLNTSKQFSDVKRECYIWALNRNTSIHFLKDVEFRHKVCVGIANPKMQLSIKLSGGISDSVYQFVTKIDDVFLKNVASAIITEYHYTETITGLNNMDTFQFIDSGKLKLIDGIKNIKHVLVKYTQVTTVKNIDNVDFKNIKTLNVSFCKKLSDLSAIYGSQLQKIDISHCESVQNTDGLLNIPTVIMNYCNNLTDVSGLRNSRDIYLCNCKNLKNVSSLKKANLLKLSNNANLSDVSALGNIPYLVLSNCELIRDVSALGNHTLLDLSYCSGIMNVDSLKNVKKLDLKKTNIRDVNGLVNVQYLNIDNCKNITNIDNLTSLKKISMLDCDKIEDLSMFANSATKIIRYWIPTDYYDPNTSTITKLSLN